MILISGIILGILKVIDVLIEIEIILIVVRAILSWFPPLGLPWLYRFLIVTTEPVLRPIRRFVPPWRTAGLDLSPLIAILVLWAIQIVIIEPVRISISIYGGAP